MAAALVRALAGGAPPSTGRCLACGQPVALSSEHRYQNETRTPVEVVVLCGRCCPRCKKTSA